MPRVDPDLFDGFSSRRSRGHAALRRVGSTAGWSVFGLAALLMIWWALAARLGALRLPDPRAVAQAIVDNWSSIPAMMYVAMQAGGIGDALVFTVTNVLLVVAVSATLGILAGVGMSYAKPLRLLLTPVIVVLGATPLLILLPFLIQWFGSGRFVRSGLVMIFTFVTVATVCNQSVGRAMGYYASYARSLGARPPFEMAHVALPAMVPDLVAALRVSLAAAWSLQAVAELIGGKAGAGRIIGTMANLANTTIILAVVVCLCVVAVVIDGVLALLAKRFLTWRN